MGGKKKSRTEAMLFHKVAAAVQYQMRKKSEISNMLNNLAAAILQQPVNLGWADRIT
jgi:hypothetical protein